MSAPAAAASGVLSPSKGSSAIRTRASMSTMSASVATAVAPGKNPPDSQAR